jgi:hypothetical protein
MKRRFLLPALAVMFAAGGAYASAKFAPVYFLNDDSCNEVNQVSQPCTIGSLIECNAPNGDHYYYKTDETSTECEQLYKDSGE